VENETKSHRGFAGMDPEKQRAIASKGGRAAHDSGKAHAFSSEEAKAAGRKGGAAHSREHMAEIGRKGGKARGAAMRGDRSEPNDESTSK